MVVLDLVHHFIFFKIHGTIPIFGWDGTPHLCPFPACGGVGRVAWWDCGLATIQFNVVVVDCHLAADRRIGRIVIPREDETPYLPWAEPVYVASFAVISKVPFNQT